MNGSVVIRPWQCYQVDTIFVVMQLYILPAIMYMWIAQFPERESVVVRGLIQHLQSESETVQNRSDYSQTESLVVHGLIQHLESESVQNR